MLFSCVGTRCLSWQTTLMDADRERGKLGIHCWPPQFYFVSFSASRNDSYRQHQKGPLVLWLPTGSPSQRVGESRGQSILSSFSLLLGHALSVAVYLKDTASVRQPPLCGCNYHLVLLVFLWCTTFCCCQKAAECLLFLVNFPTSTHIYINAILLKFFNYSLFGMTYLLWGSWEI